MFLQFLSAPFLFCYVMLLSFVCYVHVCSFLVVSFIASSCLSMYVRSLSSYFSLCDCMCFALLCCDLLCIADVFGSFLL